MKLKNIQTVAFVLFILAPFSALAAEATSTDPQLTPPATQKEEVNNTKETTVPVSQCEINTQFSNISYAELKTKLEQALAEKNKSLIFLDFKTLQAQVDVLVNHLLSLNVSDQKETLSLLEKSLAYLNQLEALLTKAKANAQSIREEHVIPLATMTSLKADYDKCQGKESQYYGIFKSLSQLNIDLTEIMMLTPQRILSHKDTVKKLIENLENSSELGLSHQDISSHLNFIQTQINTITHTFQFDVSTLNIASN